MQDNKDILDDKINCCHDECHNDCCSHEHHHDDCHDDCCSHEHHHEECHDNCCSHEHHHDGECHDEHCCCHEHEHGVGCACCAAKGKVNLEADLHAKVDKKKLAIKIATLTVAVVLAIIGSFVPNKVASIVLFVIGYLFAGYECLIGAAKHISKGKIFDENFLMVVASIGAMCIGEMREGILVMVLFGIGELLEDFALKKSKRSISSLVSLKVQESHKKVGSEYQDVATDDLTIDDIIMVKVGERIPVDGVVINGASTIDNSTITGESMPVAVNDGDSVQAGGINLNEVLEVRVTCEYKDTTVKKIIDIVENADEHKPKSERAITKFARYYTPIVVLIALIVAIVPGAITGQWVEFIHKALVFLVISCPCALVISVPLAVFSGIGGASKKGVLVKGGDILDNISSVDVVAFDKTGTLTNGVFEIVDIKTYDVEKRYLLDIAGSVESRSSHPIAKIIASHMSEGVSLELDNVEEIMGEGMSAKVGERHVLVGNVKLLDRYNINIESDNDSDNTIIYVAEDGKLIGEIYLADTIKDGAIELVSAIKKMGKSVVMLTGDRKSVAGKIASKLGIEDYRAELRPEDKKTMVDSFIADGKKVMFIGDGINDAPALVAANIGVCNNGDFNDISIEAGDVILMNGSTHEAMSMFDASKKTRSIVTENIVFSLGVKLIIAIIDMTIFPSMWLAVIADVGVTLLAILNSIRALKLK